MNKKRQDFVVTNR